jgi:hypothetical protein
MSNQNYATAQRQATKINATQMYMQNVAGALDRALHAIMAAGGYHTHLQRQDGLNIQLQEAAPTGRFTRQSNLDACKAQQHKAAVNSHVSDAGADADACILATKEMAAAGRSAQQHSLDDSHMTLVR